MLCVTSCVCDLSVRQVEFVILHFVSRQCRFASSWCEHQAECATVGCQVNANVGGVRSEANVTDIHEALHFDSLDGGASHSLCGSRDLLHA